MRMPYIPMQELVIHDADFPKFDFTKSFDDVNNELNGFMATLVQVWYNRLPDDTKHAIRLLHFSPTVVTGQMFFDEADYFVLDYELFEHVLCNYARYIAVDDDRYNNSSTTWAHDAAQGYRSYKCRVEQIQENHKATLNLITERKLREEVMKNLVDHDFCAQRSYGHYKDAIEAARKLMLNNAIVRLKKKETT